MSLAEALKHGPKPRIRPCKLGRIRGSLSPADREAFDSALGGDNLSWFQRQLRKAGYDVSYATVNRHANGDCACHG